MKWLALWLAVVSLLGGAARGAETVWIDSDPAIGPPWQEVDDAFALVLAFHSPELRIAGISTTYGNADLRRTTEVARDLVARFGDGAGLTKAEVHPGAAGPGERALRTEATEALARALRKERLTYIALGPLTNLAGFLALHPELAERITRIILVGGRSPERRFRFGPNKSFSVHDANVFKDPAAAAAVLAASRPLVLAPMELAPGMALSGAEMRALQESGEAGNYLFRRTRAWLWFWTGWVGERGGLVFDLLAILPACEPKLIEMEDRWAVLEEGGDLVAFRTGGRGRRRVRFATGIKAGAKERVLGRLKAGRALPGARGVVR